MSSEESVSTEPLRGIPMVRVLDEDGREVLRGWYAFHEKRQLCPIGDELRANDVSHLVVHSDWADWNMPRQLEASEISPPHRIVPLALRARAEPTLEQRCQQLEQLARDMYMAIAPMHEYCCEETCASLCDMGWGDGFCCQDFRSRLEELGVILDV